MDHGIEEAAGRRAANKPEVGTLRFTARRVEGRLIISVGDDGKGIDWSGVKAKAVAAGLACETHADLVEALADGFTTREQVSETSGRGVGLAALRQVVASLGGDITIRSESGQGATFEIAFVERTGRRCGRADTETVGELAHATFRITSGAQVEPSR
jgi:two-component system chemotaxis sensor kinase CheA